MQKLVDENPSWDAGQVRTALNGSSAEDFLGYMRQDVDRRALAGHPRTAEKFASIHNKLQSFRLGIPHPTGRNALGRESPERKLQRAAVTLPFGQLTTRFVRDYEQYLASLGIRNTTIQKGAALSQNDGAARH